jgi:hypothetical protein
MSANDYCNLFATAPTVVWEPHEMSKNVFETKERTRERERKKEGKKN